MTKQDKKTSYMLERGYLVTVTTKKKHWFRDDEVTITITDGMHDLKFNTAGSFVIDTDEDLEVPLLRHG